MAMMPFKAVVTDMKIGLVFQSGAASDIVVSKSWTILFTCAVICEHVPQVSSTMGVSLSTKSVFIEVKIDEACFSWSSTGGFCHMAAMVRLEAASVIVDESDIMVVFSVLSWSAVKHCVSALSAIFADGQKLGTMARMPFTAKTTEL